MEIVRALVDLKNKTIIGVIFRDEDDALDKDDLEALVADGEVLLLATEEDLKDKFIDYKFKISYESEY